MTNRIRDRYTSGRIENNGIYQELIPFSVLEKVKQIKSMFPKVVFYVSNIAISRPDPFLLVTGVGMSNIIVAHWNEPGFEE